MKSVLTSIVHHQFAQCCIQNTLVELGRHPRKFELDQARWRADEFIQLANQSWGRGNWYITGFRRVGVFLRPRVRLTN